MFNVTTLNSKYNKVSKFILEKENDITIEAVLYKYPDYKTRTVMCISVQCGCPIGCSFCGTGRKFIRNLTADEIVQQVEVIMYHIDCKPEEIGKFQIMFMSMGEPFCNYTNTKKAIIWLSEKYKNAQLLISTVAPKMIEIFFNDFIWLSQDIPSIGLQFSIHESNDKKRNRIIPDVRQLQHKGTGRKPFFNYCVKKSNSKDENIKELRELFDPEMWEVTLSVICSTWNDDQGEQEKQLPLVQDFSRRMLEAGYSTRIFNPISEYGSGCGMLHHFQDWINRGKQ